MACPAYAGAITEQPQFPAFQLALSPEQLENLTQIRSSLSTALAEVGRVYIPALNEVLRAAASAVEQYAEVLDRSFPGWRDQDWDAVIAECDRPELHLPHG